MTDQNATQTAEPVNTAGSGTGLSTADISSAMNQPQDNATQNASGTNGRSFFDRLLSV